MSNRINNLQTHDDPCMVSPMSNAIKTTNPIQREENMNSNNDILAALAKVIQDAQEGAAVEEAIAPAPAQPAVVHPLAHLVPPTFIVGDYISRDIDGVKDLDIIDGARRMGRNVLIEGPTGSAKTTLVMAAAARAGLPVVNIPCNGAAEPRIFIGGWTPQPDGTFDFVPGDLIKAVQHGGIIYLDEVNMMPPKIAVYLHALLDSRRAISIPDASGSSFPTELIAHPDCQVIATMNRNYHGTRPLNQAFRNRFAIKLSFPYLAEVEEKLVPSASLLSLATALRTRFDVGDLTTPVSTNMLLEFVEFSKDDAFGLDFATTNFINAFSPDEQPVARELITLEQDNIGKDLFGPQWGDQDEASNEEVA